MMPPGACILVLTQLGDYSLINWLRHVRRANAGQQFTGSNTLEACHKMNDKATKDVPAISLMNIYLTYLYTQLGIQSMSILREKAGSRSRTPFLLKILHDLNIPVYHTEPDCICQGIKRAMQDGKYPPPYVSESLCNERIGVAATPQY